LRKTKGHIYIKQLSKLFDKIQVCMFCEGSASFRGDDSTTNTASF